MQAAAGSGVAATFTVTSTNDSGPGSLRQAILSANINPDPDTIAFGIPGAGVQTIAPVTSLPPITDSAVIDGYTQPNSRPNQLSQGTDALLLIEIRGTNGAFSSGLEVGADRCVIRGLVISGFQTGILVQGFENRIEGNFLGTDPSGTIASRNGYGVEVYGAADNQIGGTAVTMRNLISGNGTGVFLSDSDGNHIEGNLIGLNRPGTGSLPNIDYGVALAGGTGNSIGGLVSGARNVISGNTGPGIYVGSGESIVRENVIEGNYIGTDLSGTQPIGNSTGVIIAGNGAALNRVGSILPAGRNVISGNRSNGVAIVGPLSTSNLVVGNYLGTTADGASPLGNRKHGVVILAAPANSIGDGSPSGGNVISGNGDIGDFGAGVVIQGSTASNNVVRGNLIGTDAAGGSRLGNKNTGIFIGDASKNTIGGINPFDRNVVSGHDNIGTGIEIGGDGNLIQGNLIGTDVTGSRAIGNSFGVSLTGCASNLIGGTIPGARNIVSGNDWGIVIQVATRNFIQGNFVGTDPTGTGNLGNGEYGIVLLGGGASNNVIGGIASGAANRVAFNGTGVNIGPGVGVSGNGIFANTIFDNVGLGINLARPIDFEFSVTPNDPGDTDTGPNNLQNFPILTSATGGRSPVVRGTLNSTPGTTFRLEFFANSTPDPSGHGEGEFFLEAAEMTTDSGGNLTFTHPLAVSVPAAAYLTATATDPAGNTSEFSPAVQIAAPFTFAPNAGIGDESTNSHAPAWGDYDNDGRVDLFVTGGPGQGDFLYHNNGDGSFTRMTADPVVNHPDESIAGVWGDYDNDGYLDLFVTKFQGRPCRLYHNLGDGHFALVTSGSVATNTRNAVVGAWADYENDGHLDLYVTVGRSDQQDYLYRNTGHGAFTQVQTGPLATALARSEGAAWGDIDGDGDLDLFISNFNDALLEANRLYRNLGQGSFVAITDSAVTSQSSLSAGGAWGDYDNDGDLDLFVATTARGGERRTNCALFRNRGDGAFDDVTLASLIDEGAAAACAWGDYDNDGWLDLVVARDAAFGGPVSLLHNNGDGTFTRDQTGTLSTPFARCCGGLAWADYDDDGALDLYVAPGRLYRNEGNYGNWLKVRLEGTSANRAAIGAKVRVRTVDDGATRIQLREVSGGNGWLSQNDLVQHFGLAAAPQVDQLQVEWPSGAIHVLTNVSPNQLLVVREPPPTRNAPVVLVDGRFSPLNRFTVTNSATIEIRTAFTNGHVYITLDGANPRNGFFYSGPFVITESATVRAVAFASDFSQSAEADPVVVTLRAPPRILVSPASRDVIRGDTVTFAVAAAGAEPLAYQWLFNGVPMPGETLTVLTLANVQAAAAGNFQVQVTNLLGSVTSAVAVLRVGVPPSLVTGPADAVVPIRGSNTFCVTVTGEGPFQFQWRKNGANLFDGGNLSGATNSCLTITNAQIENGGSYAVLVANAVGVILSAPALLTIAVTNRPATNDFFTNSISLTGMVGEIRGTNNLASFEPDEPRHAGRGGGRSLWYRWQAPSNGIARFRTTGSAFDTLLGVYTGTNVGRLSFVAGNDDRGGFLASEVRFNATTGIVYRIAVDGFAAATNTFVLQWDLTRTNAILPQITRPPVAATVQDGAFLFNEVEATGGTLSYEWRQNGIALPGQTRSVLILPSVRPVNVGLYTVVITNTTTGVSVESDPVPLEIGPVADVQSQEKLVDPPGSSAGGGGGTGGAARFAGASTAANAVGISVSFGAGSIQYMVAYTNQPAATCNFSSIRSTFFYLTNRDNGVLLLDTTGSDYRTALSLNYSDIYRADPWPILACVATNSAGGQTVICAALTNTGLYRVRVDGLARLGTATNNGYLALRWALGNPPVVTPAPSGAIVTNGATLTLSVIATNRTAPGVTNPIPSPTFQWRRHGNELVDATGSSLRIPSVTANDAGIYEVVVRNLIGSVTSRVAVTVIQATEVSRVVSLNDPIEFGIGVVPNGLCPAAFQWLHDGAPLAGMSRPTLSLGAAGCDTAGEYSVTVTDCLGAVTIPVGRVHILSSAPRFAFVSSDTNVPPEGTALLEARVTEDTCDAEFVWWRRGDWNSVGLGPRLILRNIRPEDTGAYYVTVANGVRATSSSDILVGLDVVKARPLVELEADRVAIYIDATPSSLGWPYAIESSADLLHWILLETNRVQSSTYRFVDPNPRQPGIFYRARPTGAGP